MSNRATYTLYSQRRRLSGEIYWSVVGHAEPHADKEGFNLILFDRPNPRGELVLRLDRYAVPPEDTAAPPAKPLHRGHLQQHSQAKLYYQLLHPYPGTVLDDDRIEYEWLRAFAHICFTKDDWALIHRFL